MSDLVGNPTDRFSYIAAHIPVIFGHMMLYQSAISVPTNAFHNSPKVESKEAKIDHLFSIKF